MIQINSEEEGNLQAYSLLFYRNVFVFVGGVNVQDLKYFSMESQNRLGKIKIKFNINLIRRLQHSHNANYIVMTKYTQILMLPFLLRGQKQCPHILTTKLALETAKIYIKDFYQSIKKMDQIVNKPSYEEESLIYDKYEEEYNLFLQEWVQLYSKKQIEDCLDKCIGLNYGQVYDTQKGILVTPFPSGHSLGSAVWLFEHTRYNDKLLWISHIFHHNWRACREFDIGNLHQQINNIVFAKDSINVKEERVDEYECVNFFGTIKQKLKQNKNCTIVLEDMEQFCDFINYISWELRDKINKIFISSVSATKMITYANSYVDFLAKKHSKRIYEDPPKYPFDNYLVYKKNKILFEGSFEEIAEKHKIPVKQLLERSTPYLNFVQDFHYYLFSGNQQKKDILFTPITNKGNLIQLLKNEVKFDKIFTFDKNRTIFEQINVEIEEIKMGQEMREKLKEIQKTYIAQGQNHNVVSCARRNNFIILQKLSKELRLLESNWTKRIAQQLKGINIKVIKQSQEEIETQNTRIELKNYAIVLESKSIQQTQLISSILNQLTTKIRIK